MHTCMSFRYGVRYVLSVLCMYVGMYVYIDIASYALVV